MPAAVCACAWPPHQITAACERRASTRSPTYVACSDGDSKKARGRVVGFSPEAPYAEKSEIAGDPIVDIDRLLDLLIDRRECRPESKAHHPGKRELGLGQQHTM